MERKQKSHHALTVYLLLLHICAMLLVGCSSSSTSTSIIQVNESSVNTASSEETIRMNNCGNLAESEQTKERSFSTSIESAAELKVSYMVVEGSVIARYGQYRSASTSQRLTAAPNTNMEFVLRWSEEVRAGNVIVDGKTGSYSVRIPIAVEQVSSRDLGCDGSSAPAISPTKPATQPQPSATPVNAPGSTRLCPMIVIEGTIEGLPIAQTQTWSELGITTQEPQSSNINDVCSRTNDNEVKVWVGYWSGDPGYLDFRGEMTPDAAISLVKQNPNQPVIIIPWGE